MKLRRYRAASPRTPNVHIPGPQRFKHPQNSTEGGGTGKQKREILGPTLRCPALQGSTLQGLIFSGFGLHPSGHHDTHTPRSKWIGPKWIGQNGIGQSRSLLAKGLLSQDMGGRSGHTNVQRTSSSARSRGHGPITASPLAAAP